MRKGLRSVLAGILAASFSITCLAGIGNVDVLAEGPVQETVPGISLAHSAASPSAVSTPRSTAKPSAPAVARPKFITVMKRDVVEVGIYGQACDGLTVQLVNDDTKKTVKTSSVKFGTWYVKWKKIPRDAVYHVQARAYMNGSSGKKKTYSAWSAKQYLVAQPSIDPSGRNVRTSSIVCKWNKVAGAQDYTMYARKHHTKKWIKIKTTKKNSYVLRKLKGKKIDTRKNAYDMMVTASAKIGGKTVTSDSDAYVYTNIL